jgi:hypothetical protein
VTHILRPGKASEKTLKGVIPPSLCEILQNAPRKKKHVKGVPTSIFSSVLDLVTKVDIVLIAARLSFSTELPPIVRYISMIIVAADILLTEVMPAFSSRWWTVTLSLLLHFVRNLATLF